MTKEEFAKKWDLMHLYESDMLSDLNSVIRDELIKYDRWLEKGRWMQGRIPGIEAVDAFLNEHNLRENQ